MLTNSLKISIHKSLAVVVLGSATLLGADTKAASGTNHCGDVGFSDYDSTNVDRFYRSYIATTGQLIDSARERELDARLRARRLKLQDKIEVLKRLSPPDDATSPSKEIRMERLILSIDPKQLPLLKFTVDYDGDYKDMTEYVFHDIDNPRLQNSLIAHFAKNATKQGIKVLSDVDDTLYANLVDTRYPKKTLYPGVITFYAALAEEPFRVKGIPITTLSARPSPIGGKLEEGSIGRLVKLTGQALCPSALSGEVVSSAFGTLETWYRANSSVPEKGVPHVNEDKIGEVKFANFAAYSQVYPEYHYVFIGDSGQADSITADKMVSDRTVDGTDRVITTFIHDLRRSPQDMASASHSFLELDSRLKVTIDSKDPRGVIVFRNYIEAATVAYAHADELNYLITTEELGQIISAALKELRSIEFSSGQDDRARLFHEYREDTKKAIAVLRSRREPGATHVREEIEKTLAKWER